MKKFLTQLSIPGYHGTIEAEVCISTINLAAVGTGGDKRPSLEPSSVTNSAGWPSESGLGNSILEKPPYGM